MANLASLFLIESSSFLQITRETSEALISSNFGQIQHRIVVLATLKHLEISQ